MEIKYIKEDTTGGLSLNEIYKVFCIEWWDGNSKLKFYVKSASGYIYPNDLWDFLVIDNTLPTFWKIIINWDGNLVIWPEEIFKMEYFWEHYYNDVPKYREIVEKYFWML